MVDLDGAPGVTLRVYRDGELLYAASAGEPFGEQAVPVASAPARQRYAADASNRTARPAFNGLPALGDDLVNIVVRPAAEVDAARI